MSDPLAPIERLLDETLSGVSIIYEVSGLSGELSDAREAVRLLLDLARLHVSVTHEIPQHAALLAFAARLEGESE